MELKKYLDKFLLGLIIIVAIVTRFYMLGDAPSGFYVDEAGQGYSAYSILKTGKDEFGKNFPIVFRSLTDFKTPVYVYLIVPLIPIFGLNPITVRLPSFVFSILTIPVLYFLINCLTKNRTLSLISVALLAISPWHILFGRTNFECNVALFFYLSGIFAFYKSLKKPKLLLISALMFAIAVPAYHSQRIITPLTLLVLFIKYNKTLLLKSHKIFLIFGIVIGLIILTPTLSIITTPGFLARASGLNIFTNTQGHNFIYTVREFVALYFSYFSSNFMFNLGDYGARSSFPELSTFFLWQFPFYLWGLWILFKEKIDSDLKFFVVMMFLISPIPAAVTRDPYTTIRALPLVIPQIIIISLALNKIISNKLYALCFIILLGYSILKLYSSVIILNEYYRPRYWDYGWKEVAEFIQNSNSKRVTIDNVRVEPDLNLAFFLKYDPAKYQLENYEVPLTEYYTNLYRNREKHIGNITTRAIDWKNDLGKDQILIGDELAISLQQIEVHKLKLIKEIKYPDGSVAYRIVQTNPEFYELEQKLFNSRK